MLLLVGQVARETVGREGFQELDYRAVFGPMAKWATQVDDAARLPELVARAFAVATSGPARAGGPRAARGHAHRRGRRARRARRTGALAGAAPADGDMARLGELLAQARAPLVDRRRGRLDGADRRRRRRVRRGPARAGRRLVPLPGLRRQRARPPTPGHAGLGDGPGAGAAHPRGRRAAGDRRAPGRDPDRRLHARAPRRPTQRLVHVHPDPDELGAVYQPELGIVVGPRGASRPPPARSRRRAPSARAGLLEAARGEYERNLREARELPGAAADVGGDGGAARAPARRRDPHQRRRQLQRLGAPLLRVPPLPDAARARAAARWATASRPRSPPRPCTPTARSSASPATATS